MEPECVEFRLACGARVMVRVVVDGADCQERDGRCMTAAEIAGVIWLALQEPSPAVRTSGA